MAQRITIQQYDNGVRLVFTIKKDGLIESLSGSKVTLLFSQKQRKLAFERECIIVDPITAECEYTLTDEDTEFAGSYVTKLVVEYPNGVKLQRDNPIILTIAPDRIYS